MQITQLSLTNFRNFIRLETDIPSGPTLLVGANAQGKTSLLEAVHFLVGATSLHAASDRQLINFLALEEPQPVARIVADLLRGGHTRRIEIRIILDPIGPAGETRLRKEILINGVKKRARDLAAGFNAVLFLPQDMRVIEGSPGDRRRHLDQTLSQGDSAYAAALSQYGKILSQRNALLKQLQERNGSLDQLRFWDEQLVEHASSVIRGRALALHELEQRATRIHSQLTEEHEVLRIEYLPAYTPTKQNNQQKALAPKEAMDWTAIPREQLRDGLLQSLEQLRREEIARGLTLLGPQRDDVRFSANGIDLRLYGSRGQNRTAMLATKLAEVDWLHARSGEWPVLLLDEVLAELDPARRDALLARVTQVNQSLLTAADLRMFNQQFQEQSQIWQIHAGTVRRLPNG